MFLESDPDVKIDDKDEDDDADADNDDNDDDDDDDNDDYGNDASDYAYDDDDDDDNGNEDFVYKLPFTLAHAFALPHKTNCFCLHLLPSLSSLLLIGDLRCLAHASKSRTPSLHRHSRITCSGVRCLWSLPH